MSFRGQAIIKLREEEYDAVTNASDSNNAVTGAPEDSRGSRTRRSIRRWVALGLLTTILVASASPAFADRYNKGKAGHPLRIAAYVLYPVGALLDVLIMRPAHWLVSQEPFKSSVGHED